MQPSQLPDPESDSLLAATLERIEHVTKWRKFRETRASIKKGEDLFAASDAELKQCGLMTPLRFNLYQIVIAAIPSQVSIWVFDYVFPFESKYLPFVGNILSKFVVRGRNKLAFSLLGTDAGTNLIEAGDKLTYLVLDHFYWLLGGLILLGAAWYAIEGCLNRKDLKDPAKRTLIRRAYFFYNGAYALMPQTLLNLVVVFIQSVGRRNVRSEITLGLYVILLLLFVCYQVYVTYYKIPKLLFQLARDYRFTSYERHTLLRRFFHFVKYSYNMAAVAIVNTALTTLVFVLANSVAFTALSLRRVILR